MTLSADYPLVSVVIPSFNHSAYIHETIQSVCDQTWPEIEIIVIDDGSTDGSQAILKSMTLPNLRVYFQENRGTSETINRGIALAHGTYISILNSDDLYDLNRIETLVSMLETECDRPGIAFSWVRFINDAGDPLSDGEAVEWLEAVRNRLTPDTSVLFALLRDNFTCTSSNFIFHRSLIDTIGEFRNYRYVTDLDFLTRAIAEGSYVFLQEPLLSCRIHASNTLNKWYGEKDGNYLYEWGNILAGMLESWVDYGQSLHKERLEKDRIWRERQYFADAYEQVINSKRYRLFGHLAALKSFKQPFYHSLEIFKLAAPPKLVNRLRKFRDRKNYWIAFYDKGKAKWHQAGKWMRKQVIRPVRVTQTVHNGPLISVIVPCHNDGAFLDRMLESLSHQTWRDFEVIIVDDGSTDPETVERINALIAQPVPNRIVVRQASAGVIAARNHAVSLSSGKYLFPLDPGGSIDKTFLEKLVFFLEHSNPKTFVYSHTRSTDKEAFVWETRDTDPVAVLEENRCGFAVFPRSAFDAAGGYSPVMADGCEDWELCVHMVRCGYAGRVVPEPLYLNGVKPGARNHHAVQQHARLKQLISDRHGQILHKDAAAYRKQMRKTFRVDSSRVNLDEKAILFPAAPLWLDLMGMSFAPARLFSDLLRYADAAPAPVLVTVDENWGRFFDLNPHPNLFVYIPAHYHPDGEAAPFTDWLRDRYAPLPLEADELSTGSAAENAADSDNLSILYVGPWLITGGADTMTVDWFRHLAGEGTHLYYATTLPKKNVWIDKLRGLADGIYELPELGCEHPDVIGDFINDFIEKNRIRILHIMNSPPVYEVLPVIRKAHPDLKIVAQFHCFDYLADGTKVGYSVDVPARLDGIVDAYNVESISHQKEIQELYPYIPDEKFHCIYGCIDSELFDPKTVDPDPSIIGYRNPEILNLLFIGRLDRQKQPLVMMAVAKGLKDAGVAFRLHVVGDGSLESQKSEAREYCRKHGLDEQVRFYGDQPLATMPSWYAVGDVMLLTSMWEGIPIVLYQAMSMGRVCVAPDVGGISELIGPDAGVVIPDRTDVNAYVRAIAELAADPDSRRAMGAMARERIRSEFDIRSLGPAYRAFYRKLSIDGNSNPEARGKW